MPDLKQLYEGNDTARRVIDLARRLEGVARNASIHACGVIISKLPLMEIAPLQKMPGGDEVVVQYEMKTVDLIGLLKMDFLGLRNLTIINDALDFIRRTRAQEVDLTTISYEDQPTFKLLQEARTSGVFQVESAGMRRYLRALKPERFSDIVAMVALYRPGPIQGGVVDRYINCKHGREAITYPHPATEEILKETYGFMIYQEQVMQISNVLAKFTLAEADDLRKAMGKKNPAVMAKQREKFVKGCVANEIDEKLAGEIFDLMEKFAGYGFNKSHSAAYALVTYQTAWLKANYPVEYMCALLTSVMSNSDKVSFFVKECRSLGLTVLPPSVNHSRWKFEVERLPEGGWGVRFGLGAIKNVGESAVAAIVAEREAGGPFRSLPDLCRRVDQKQLNKRVLECLVVAGAMDGLGGTRAQLLTVLDDCIEYGQLLQKDAHAGQASLFESGGEEATEPELPLVEEYEKSDMLAVEKELLGIHMSDSPLTEFAAILEKPPFVTIQALEDLQPGSKVSIGGMVTSLRRILTKTKSTMAFLEVEDMTGSIEVTLLPKDYERCGSKIEVNQIVQVKGKLELRQARGAKPDDDEEGEAAEEPVEEMKVLGEDISALQNLNRFYQAVQEANGEAKRLPAPRPLPRANKPVEVAPVNTPPRHFYLQVGDMSDWSSRNDDRREAAPGEGSTPQPRFMEGAVPPAGNRSRATGGSPPVNGHAAAPPGPAAPAEVAPQQHWPPQRDGVHVRISLAQRSRLAELKGLLLGSRGDREVYLHLESPEGRTVLSLGRDFSVSPSQEFLSGAEKLLGRGAIHIEPAKGKT
ncbi:MAG: DNA polymerase III subunit alpha [Candidatus Xenobia bacterium]